ncbi:RICIN domain-containing protein [Chloroflexota bacterium]
MKTIRVALVSILCLVFILTPLSIITGCKADEPSGYSLQTGAPLGGAISSAGLDLLLGGLAEGALSWAGGQACDFVFGLITGSAGKEGQELDDIKNKLDEMDEKLNDIKETVEKIEEKVDELTKDLERMEWNIATKILESDLTTIGETFKKVIRITQAAKKDPVKYQDDVETLSLPDGEILNSTTGVVHAVGVIHNFMISQDGLLELRLKNLSQGLNYENGADRYDAFAAFFTALLGWEIQGVELIVNAYAGQDKPDLAVSYLRDFYEDKLVLQVNLFSNLVEKMVWENNDMRWSEVILDPEPYIFPSADYLANTLLNSYYGDEEGNLKTGEDKGIITARIRYSDETTPLSSIQFINTSSNSEQIITLEAEEPTRTEDKYNVLVYKYESPPNGTYKLRTVDHPAILHDYGENEIVITDVNRYGSIGIYAWAPSSDYYQIINRNSGLTIDATGKSDRANIHQWIYYGFDNQLWKFEHVDNGYYKITNKYSGKVLDVLSYSKDDKANVIQYTWNNTTNQRWRLHKIRDGHLVIINENSGKVLDIKDGTRGNGGNLQQYRRRDSGNQTFEIQIANSPATDAGQLWKFIPKSKRDDRLDVRGGQGSGSVIQTWKKNETLAQKWQLVWKEGAYYRLTPQCDKKTAASVRGNSKNWGAIIQTWTYEKGQSGQLWKFEPVGSGYYRIVNKNSGMVMEKTNDAVHQLKWSDADKDMVKWEIIKTSIK